MYFVFDLITFSIKVREEEMVELEELVQDSCPLRLKRGALATVPGKINCLIQVNNYIICFSLETSNLEDA